MTLTNIAPASIDLVDVDIIGVIPGDVVSIGNRLMQVGQISHDNGAWTIDLRLDDERVSLTTSTGWTLPADTTGTVDQYTGLRIGDVVTRGKGKLAWRIYGLGHHADRPMISLVSMPVQSAKSTSGLGVSSQTFAVVGDDAIATLNRVPSK
ncbi:Uncharacterised protein [Mycobacteroides abscessus subsp. abscessus]|nr:Uncharacterised protein [Mycobacteroides abscessus subsp. abscessus]